MDIRPFLKIEKTDFDKANYEKFIEERKKYIQREIDRFLKEFFGDRFFAEYKEEYVNKVIKKKVENAIANNKGLFITGNVGSGKTTTLLYIMKKLLIKETEGLLEVDDLDLESVFSLFYIENSVKFFNTIYSKVDHIVEDVKYLAIDDLGVEYESEKSYSFFDYIVDESYRNGFPILYITTNIPFNQFCNKPNFVRAMDRIKQITEIIEIQSPSHR